MDLITAGLPNSDLPGLTITIVRHGNTFNPGETPRRIGARTDLPLVPSGIRQAQALGEAFAGQGLAFDRALAAPLSRTRETIAHILNHQRHAPNVETIDWLKEIDHGPDENQPETAVIDRIGAAALAAWDVQAQVPDGWIVDVDRRLAGWRGLLASGSGRVLIVTSNGAARFALLADPALQAGAAALPSLKLRTGAYGTMECRGDALRLLGWDCRP
jgi:broad specificity phosphatase PhoE